MTQEVPTMTPARWILVVLAAWGVMMIVPDVYRVFRPLASFGLVANNDGVIVNGPFANPSQSPAAVAGIVAGDRIDLKAMRCVPLDAPHCGSLLAVLGGLGGTQIVLADHEIDLAIESASRGGARNVHLRAARTPHGWIDSLVLLADTIVGVIVILAAFRLVWVHPGMTTWG